MKGKILNNFSLKILSVICAIIFWAAIVNIYDPNTSITIPGVTVVLENTKSLTDKDYTFEVMDGSKISVVISGPRTVVNQINATDIIATADLSKVTAFSDYVDIQVKISKDGVNTSSVEVIPKTTAVKLSIENRVSKTLNIQIQVAGTPANGYFVSESKISLTTVKLTGSASAINNVDSVKAIYDVSGASMDISDTAHLSLYDVDGNIISDSKIEMGKTDVEFKATILPSKTVPVKFKVQGEVAAGYKLTGFEYSSTEVVLIGTEDNLKKIDSIEITADAIDINNLQADTNFLIDVKKYVPSYVSIASESTITATAKIALLIERQFTISLDSINLLNLPDGCSVSYGNAKELKISVAGTEAVLNTITAANLKSTIDVSGITEGTVSVALNVILPTGASLKQNYEVEVNITNNNKATTAADNPTAATAANNASTAAN